MRVSSVFFNIYLLQDLTLLTLQKVIQDWLDKTKMFGVKVTSTPLPTTIPLQLDAIAPVDPVVYESVISFL